MELPVKPLADISDGCNLSSISRKRDVRLCVCKNRKSVQETAIKAMNSADLKVNKFRNISLRSEPCLPMILRSDNS